MSLETDISDETAINTKDNIQLLNTFSKDFFSTHNVINEKISAISAKIDILIEEEKKNDNILTILQSKITATELGNNLKNLVSQRVILNDKSNELNTLRINNSKKIELITNSIKENKQLIDSVYKIISLLDENINNINDTISNVTIP
jgi:chromosome segregation ATPase